jgi:hypothetical protein
MKPSPLAIPRGPAASLHLSENVVLPIAPLRGPVKSSPPGPFLWFGFRDHKQKHRHWSEAFAVVVDAYTKRPASKQFAFPDLRNSLCTEHGYWSERSAPFPGGCNPRGGRSVRSRTSRINRSDPRRCGFCSQEARGRHPGRRGSRLVSNDSLARAGTLGAEGGATWPLDSSSVG